MPTIPPTLSPPTPPRNSGTAAPLKRSMEARHLVMIAMGGVIGSGLFLGSGYTIGQAGPLGAVLAYLVGAFVVYLVMTCLGELALAYPVAGAFHIYAARSIGPATGFTTAWLYWLCWAVALGSEFTACGILMQRWFPGVDVWIWCVVFAALIFGLNAFSTRVFGESEFWLSLVKVGTIVALIVIGGAALVGFQPLNADAGPPLLFSNFTTEAGLFPHGFTGVLVTTLAVFYAFSGSELIGVAAGETRNPETAIPKAIRATVFRLLVFFVGAITVIAATVPYHDVGLDESPFVTVFSSLGIPHAGDIMNFVIITALLSAGNSGLYSCARMLFSLADEGHAPHAFRRLTARGVPLVALAVSMVGGIASLLSSVVAAESVYLVLVSIAGFAVVGVWMSIVASHFCHRRAFVRDGGNVTALPYRAPLFPYVPILAFVLCLASVVGLALDPNQSAALYFGIPFVAACYLWFYLRHGRPTRRASTAAVSHSSTPDESTSRT
ncbi:amino acid permease [Pseudarthrobacter sp. PS3-L1]|uniref:amino acid permease n=1 Tax=Pseudarthrobacter sp. PS3-L1 TaxID=3046207 RepID=UPI0024B87D3D|nr:amino acid permease [Pseudarthrobacter sp. PS3-L1]MDJ0319446.1 amino acid permease [Pseudarthrobacter sp. PS3-L1]